MNKKDWLPVLVLLALILAYPTIDRKIIARYFPAKTPPPVAPAAPPEDAGPATAVEPSLAAAPETPEAADEPADAPEETAPPADEVLTTLSNSKLQVTFSSHGAGIVRAAILDYPAAIGSAEPVTFDFSDRPAAAPAGFPGLQPQSPFEVVASTDHSLTYRQTLRNGLSLTRLYILGERYHIRIEDRIENLSDRPLSLKGYGLQSGFMAPLPEEAAERTPRLGLDTLTGSDAVQYWGAKFSDWFSSRSGKEIAIPGPGKTPVPVDWAAVKNKYFVQILDPEDDAERCWVEAEHGPPIHSSFLFLFPRTTYPIRRIAARLELPDYTLAPGQILTPQVNLYLGPKVYHELKAHGPHQEDILQLGFWRPIGILILKIMVWIQAHIWPHNYGVAILLLTFLIRLVFWPLNHKSMVSTRHMQEIQPLINAVREKYKDNPQRQHQEMMALYKEHKINPMGGCLPMLIQIPVFFALYTVLSSAIELRFSSFLWIADLSTPENLLKDVLPIPLNLLPLFMGLTMWIQQKMTPAGDPQQQRMMMMMPILFTFMFYSFPSGLSLYWSLNQVMMIIQLAWMKKHHPPLPLKK